MRIPSKLGFKVIKYASYSPNPVLSNYRLFEVLTENLRRRCTKQRKREYIFSSPFNQQFKPLVIQIFNVLLSIHYLLAFIAPNVFQFINNLVTFRLIKDEVYN
jgi:hypothetical protein